MPGVKSTPLSHAPTVSAPSSQIRGPVLYGCEKSTDSGTRAQKKSAANIQRAAGPVRVELSGLTLPARRECRRGGFGVAIADESHAFKSGTRGGGPNV